MHDSSPGPLVFSGKLILGLGLLGLVRFIPETMVWGLPGGGFYLRIVLLDILCAVLSITGGFGLVRAHRWAMEVACAAVGAQFSVSVLWMIHFLPWVGRSGEALPRLMFYGITLLLSPYLAIRLVNTAKSQAHSDHVSERFSRMLTLILAAVIGFTASIIIRYLD
jgi:hypothetical protein